MVSSSSSSTRPTPNPNKVDEKDWLQLSLGLVIGPGPGPVPVPVPEPEPEPELDHIFSYSGSTSSFNVVSLPPAPPLSLSLGLGLGFETNHAQYEQQTLPLFPVCPTMDENLLLPVNQVNKPPEIWFTLHPLSNRGLPPLHKPFIRVKNKDMTILMVKKYLVEKLGLCNEDQIDISCMGLKLPLTVSLKNVRDDLWIPRFLFVPQNATAFVGSEPLYLLPLHYGRHC